MRAGYGDHVGGEVSEAAAWRWESPGPGEGERGARGGDPAEPPTPEHHGPKGCVREQGRGGPHRRAVSVCRCV